MVPGLNVPQGSYAKGFKEDKYFLFYWGHGSEAWCQNNHEELLDSRRVGGGINEPNAALLYCGEERLKYKEMFKWSWPKCSAYDQFNRMAPEVQEFIARIEKTWKPSDPIQQSTL